jgi:hypothetical protein
VTTPRAWILPVSARSRAAVVALRLALADHLEAHEPELATVAATLVHGRERFAYRAAAVAIDLESAVRALRGEATDERSCLVHGEALPHEPRVVLADGQPNIAHRLADAGVQTEAVHGVAGAAAARPDAFVAVAPSSDPAAAAEEAGAAPFVTTTFDPSLDPEVAVGAVLAELWCLGLKLELAPRGAPRTHLPTYRFDRPGSPAFDAESEARAAVATARSHQDAFLLRRELRRRLGVAPAPERIASATSEDELVAVCVEALRAADAARPDRLRRLTPLQQRVLFQELVRAAPSSEHNLSAVAELADEPDVAALAAAFETLQRERAELRTTFREGIGGWGSAVAAEPLATLEVRREDAAEVAAEAFSVVDAPLVRAAVVHESEPDAPSQLVVVLHRALSDTATPDELVDELLAQAAPVAAAVAARSEAEA